MNEGTSYVQIYTRDGFVERIDEPLKDVNMSVWRWEHKYTRWIEAYRVETHVQLSEAIAKERNIGDNSYLSWTADGRVPLIQILNILYTSVKVKP